MKLIDKDALVAEIKRIENELNHEIFTDECLGKRWFCSHIKSFLDNLEVKEDKDNSLENFKSLQHISGDLKQTLEDWGYAPNLYHFDGSWHVSWIHCSEGDALIDFSGSTPEDAIDKACDWFHSTFCNC